MVHRFRTRRDGRILVNEFDAEMLAFALDGDTVQNVVPVAAERSGMAPQEVLNRVGAAVTRGEIRLYIDDDEHAAPNGGGGRADSIRSRAAGLHVDDVHVAHAHAHAHAHTGATREAGEPPGRCLSGAHPVTTGPRVQASLPGQQG